MNFDEGGIGVGLVHSHGGNAGGVRDLIGVIGGALAAVAAQERVAGDVANAGAEGDFDGGQVGQGAQGLDVFEGDEDEVVGLEVVEGEGEEVVAFGFDKGDAAAFGLLLGSQLHGCGAFEDLGEDEAAVDVGLAVEDGGVRGQREEVFAIEGPGVLLPENLGDLNFNQTGADGEVALDALEGQRDAGGILDGNEAEPCGRR